MVIVIVMLERKIPVKARQPMEQSACHDQVHVVLVVQNHQLKLTNNPLACLSRSTGVIYNVRVHEYYIRFCVVYIYSSCNNSSPNVFNDVNVFQGAY